MENEDDPCGEEREWLMAEITWVCSKVKTNIALRWWYMQTVLSKSSRSLIPMLSVSSSPGSRPSRLEKSNPNPRISWVRVGRTKGPSQSSYPTINESRRTRMQHLATGVILCNIAWAIANHFRSRDDRENVPRLTLAHPRRDEEIHNAEPARQ